MVKELLEMLSRHVRMVLVHTRACGISHCSQIDHVNSKRLNKEHVSLLLNVSTGMADVLRAAFVSVFLVLGGKARASKDLPAMDEDQDRLVQIETSWAECEAAGKSWVVP